MPRWAVSIASATPSPSDQMWRRKVMVASKSMAGVSQGSMSARGSATTWTAESAVRVNPARSVRGKGSAS